MKVTLEDGLRALREASEQAKSIKIELDDEYLALIARVEARTENQSGADKSWVWRLDRAFRDYYNNVRYVGPARCIRSCLSPVSSVRAQSGTCSLVSAEPITMHPAVLPSSSPTTMTSFFRWSPIIW